MNGQNALFTVVPLIFPITQDGALTSDIFSMKNFDQADIYIQIGTVTKAGAVTLSQGTAVSAATTSLPFTKYFSTGFVLKYTTPTVAEKFTAGETITGAGGGVGYVSEDLGDRVICYAHNGTTFVDGEVLTGGTSGKLAKANGIQINEDIMVERTASSNTFNCAAVAAKQYSIPINSSMLTDGYDTVKVSIADMDSSGQGCFVVLSKPRFAGSPMDTAIYD